MKKYAPYILITFFALIGLFSPIVKTYAQTPVGHCHSVDSNVTDGRNEQECSTGIPRGLWVLDKDVNTPGICNVQGVRNGSYAILRVSNITIANCNVQNLVDSGQKMSSTPPSDPENTDTFAFTIPATPTTPPTTTTTAPTTTAQTTDNKAAFQAEIDKWECGLAPKLGGGSLPGCFVGFMFYYYYALPAFLLWLVAYLFNVLTYVSINPDLFNSSFVGDAWAVVRDISNIFFILILLYIAIKIILDLGAGEAKKMIARVIIVAMLINFSMFFTKVIIDSSNILALIFYNKVGTQIKKDKGIESYFPATGKAGEQDISGAMVANFDPTRAFDKDFIRAAKSIYGDEVHLKDADYDKEKMPIPLIIALLLTAGSMMYYVAVVLAIAALAFLVRLIELWVLIIFSPFAFMSSTVPLLSNKVEYIGWSKWFSRLIKTAFMAPIFMFFLYFIFLLIKANIFAGIIPDPTTGGNSGTDLIKLLLKMVLPLTLVMILLYKALRFAVESSGKIGEIAEKAVVGTVKAAGTLALAAATEGASLAATSTLGAGASKVAGSEGLRTAAVEGGFFKRNLAKATLRAADYTSKASFDIRKAPGAEALGKFSGLSLQGPKILGLGSKEGGFKGRVEAKAKAYKEESELYKTKKSDKDILAESEAKRKDYEDTKNKAREAQGKNFNEEAYEKANPKPAFYGSAAALNSARMKAFQEKLGKGILPWGVKAAGVSAFAKSVEKDFAQMAKITERLQENTKALENIQKLLGEGVKDGLVSGSKETGFTVDTEKIESRLANLAVQEKQADLELAEGIRSGKKEEDDENFRKKMDTIRSTMFDATVEKARLNKLKTASKEERSLQKAIYDFGKEQSSIAEKQAAAAKPKPAEKKDDHSAPKAAPAKAEPKHEEPAHAAPAEAHPAPSSGGEGHGGGH